MEADVDGGGDLTTEDDVVAEVVVEEIAFDSGGKTA